MDHQTCAAQPSAGDGGPAPTIVNIALAARENSAYRSALWTGAHLQMTLMSIPVRGEIGFEMHADVDQFLRVEQGRGIVLIGSSGTAPTAQQRVGSGDGIFIPAGTWHNVLNEGFRPLKLSSIYAPPNHPRGIVQQTKEDADKDAY